MVMANERCRVDVAEAAARVRLGDMPGREPTCVRRDLRVSEIADLFVTDRLRALPVVDDAHRLIGIVTKTDLLRVEGRARGNAFSPVTVAEIMTPIVHGLPEDAPVAYAIALMAFERLHEVPVVDAEGRVLGMVTAIDALRWVAGALGYVVPAG